MDTYIIDNLFAHSENTNTFVFITDGFYFIALTSKQVLVFSCDVCVKFHTQNFRMVMVVKADTIYRSAILWNQGPRISAPPEKQK